VVIGGVSMIKILDSNLNRQGVIKKAINPNRFEEINGENTLTFSSILDNKLISFLNENTSFELNNDYFDIAYYKKNANSDDSYTVDIEAEHISYRLNNPELNVEYFTEMGTPTYILGKILESTGFTVGDVEYSEIVTYSAQEAKSRRQLLMEFVAYLGGEAYFNKFKIGIVQHRGNLILKPVIKGKNVTVVSKIFNKRETDKAGNYLVSYTCEPIYLPGDEYSLGDEVLLIQKKLGIQEQLRVVRLSYDPYDNMNAVFELANYINGLEDDAYRIETSTLTKGKTYYGARISPENGFESIRSDKMARTVMNADTIAMQAGDGSGSNWTNKLYFDPATGKYVFDGALSATMIEALEAQFDITISNTTITQTLAAETGTIAQLTVDQVETSTKVQNYLASNTADVNYQKIYEQHHLYITASTDGSQTEQATDRNGNLLYWVDDMHAGTTLEETDYPVIIYVYTEYIKMDIGFEFDGENQTPQIILGTGDGVLDNSAKSIIRKVTTGLELNHYKSNTGELRQIRLVDDGVFINGVRYELTSLNIASNSFQASYGDVVQNAVLTKDVDGRITAITSGDVVIPITYNEV